MAKAQRIVEENSPNLHLSHHMKMILASLHLEDITLSPESIADLQSVEAGKLSKKEAIARVLARVKR
jgi:hypothetical protein